MVGLDKSYLRKYGVDADSIAAYLPISGQTVTHFTIRKERALPEGIPVIDRYAPCNKARKNTPPFILITGDRNLEMADRYEENALLASVLKNIGNQKVSLYELQGFDHGQVYTPGLLSGGELYSSFYCVRNVTGGSFGFFRKIFLPHS